MRNEIEVFEVTINEIADALVNLILDCIDDPDMASQLQPLARIIPNLKNYEKMRYQFKIGNTMLLIPSYMGQLEECANRSIPFVIKVTDSSSNLLYMISDSDVTW